MSVGRVTFTDFENNNDKKENKNENKSKHNHQKIHRVKLKSNDKKNLIKSNRHENERIKKENKSVGGYDMSDINTNENNNNSNNHRQPIPRRNSDSIELQVPNSLLFGLFVLIFFFQTKKQKKQ